MSYEEDFDREPANAPRLSAEVKNDSIEATIAFDMPSSAEIADALARRWAADYSIGKDLRELAASRFDALISEAVDGAAKAAIADAMMQSRQPTDEFGNPSGVPRTFAQMIGEQVKAWQDQTVDPYNGSPKAKSGYSGNDNVITRSEYLVRAVGAAEFKKMAEAAVLEVRNDAKAKIATTIKDTVAASLAALSK